MFGSGRKHLQLQFISVEFRIGAILTKLYDLTLLISFKN